MKEFKIIKLILLLAIVAIGFIIFWIYNTGALLLGALMTIAGALYGVFDMGDYFCDRL